MNVQYVNIVMYGFTLKMVWTRIRVILFSIGLLFSVEIVFRLPVTLVQ